MDDDDDDSGHKNSEQFIPLAMSGGIKKFKMLNPNNLFQKDEHGNTYLHRAILETGVENEDMISYLLNEVPHLTEELNNDNETPLCLACKIMAHHEIISALIDCSPNVINIPDNKGKTPLYYLVGENFYYLKKPTTTSENKDDHIGEYDSLTKSENTIPDVLKIAKCLIDKGANINQNNIAGHSLLIHSIITRFHNRKSFNNNCNKSDKMIELLLDNGAQLNWNKVIESSNVPRSMYKSLIESIIKVYPSIINKEDDDNKTVLHHIILLSMLDIKKRCEIIEFLLNNEAINKPSLDPIKLACEIEIEYPIIEILLKLQSEYDINTKYKDGFTILLQYGNTINVVEKLLKLGANPNSIADNGNNALFTAIEGNCCKSVTKLLEAGADPLVINKQSQSILSLIIEKCLQVNTSEFLYEWLKLLKYILKMPQLHTINNTDTLLLFTVYYKLISTVCIKYISDVRKQRMIHIMSIILMYTKDTINKLFIKTIAVNNGELYETIICKLLQLSLPMPSMQYPYLEEFIMLMLDSGIHINYTRNDFITPLSALMKIEYNKQAQVMGVNVEKEPESNLAKEFISRGVNVESNAYITSIGKDHVRDIKLPDALYFAYAKGKSKSVELLIHYWWAPPLLLIPCNAKVRNIDLAKVWLPLLMKYGGIPHGTPLFKVTNNFIQKLQNHQERGVFGEELSEHFKTCFSRYKEISETPISLQELCKYKVRHMLADRATSPDTSLPALLKQVLPEHMVYLASH